MIKIFYDYKIFYNQKYGGPSRYFLSLINSVIKKGNKCLINSPVYYNEYLKMVSLFKPEIVNGKFLSKRLRYTTKILELYNYLITSKNLNFKNKFDVYHPTYYGKSILNFFKIPTVLTVHDLIHEKFNKNIRLKSINNKIDLIKKADKIICVSKHTQNDLINIYNINKNKTVVIYPGVENIFINKDKDRVQLKLNPYILYVGTRNKYKNYQNFLKAFMISNKLKNDFKIVFFGGGNFTKIEQNYFVEIGIKKNNIDYYEGDDNVLKQFYLNASALIYPSLYEGFGSVPLEAMNFGCPVVSSNASCLPEVQGNGSLKFDPNSIEDIKSKLEDILYSEELKKKQVKLGNERVKKFTWEECANQTISTYKNII